MRPRTRVLAATMAVTVLIVAAGATVFAPRTLHAAGPTGEVPVSIADRYLTVRPPLGDVTVVSIVGESAQRKLLAATLQGVVNRSSARIYLVGAGDPNADQHWLDVYAAAGLIHITAHLDLDQALAAFKGEVSGFVVASYSEPWTIDTATSVAAEDHGLVATADEVPMLEGLGLTEIADHVGRWSDAATAYEQIAAQVRGHLAYQGLAIVKPAQNALRDFLVQQGIMAISTRPSDADYDRIMHLLDPYPNSHPVYGYVADNDSEELTAIVHLSQQGRFLVPTDTTDNLSFHIAVAAHRPRVTVPGDKRPVAACTSSQVNVVVGTTDGDNLVAEEQKLPTSSGWGSTNRGTLPIGWGISPVTAILMPAIWDSYAATATDNDEIVGMMGMGYTAPSLSPDPMPFLADSDRLNALLGIQTHWTLDLVLDNPASPAWNAVANAARFTGWQPGGYLLDYDHYGAPPVFFGAGVPVLTSQATRYLASPSDMATQIQGLIDTPPAQRPLVNLLPATLWSANYDGLASALTPLVDSGKLRLLTPRQAWACLAAAGVRAPTTTTPPSTATDVTTNTTTTTTAANPTTAGSTPITAIGPPAVIPPSAPAGLPAAPLGVVPRYVG
ncbi:MAG: hypothetical protein JST73_02575 [Actinobacteria bacterium]|nr:hypothetical protein [Actinomycetota bacterium]